MESIATARKWTDEQLMEAVRSSTSLAQVARRLGLRSASSGLRTLPRHIARLGLDTGHLVGRRASGNRTRGRFNERPLSTVLALGTECGSSWLKRKLLEANLLKYECSECHLTEWCDKPLALQLDHRNGNRVDNRIENLRLLCPNCHSQTPTFAGRNSRKFKNG